MRITSGRCRRAASIASSPVPASATTSMSSWIRRTMAKPPRTSAWSSTTTTRMLTPARLRRAGGRRRGTRRPGAAPRRGCRRTAVPARACRRCRDLVPALGAARSGHDGGAVTVVEHLDDDPVSVGAEPHLGAGAGTGVLEHVGQRLLDDAVRGQVHAGREVGRHPVHRQRDVQTRLADLRRRAGGDPRGRAGGPGRRGRPPAGGPRAGGAARPAPAVPPPPPLPSPAGRPRGPRRPRPWPRPPAPS